MEADFCPLLRGPSSDPDSLASSLEDRIQAYVNEVKNAQTKIQEMITKAEIAGVPGMLLESNVHNILSIHCCMD